jgi:hypothetical protein
VSHVTVCAAWLDRSPLRCSDSIAVMVPVAVRSLLLCACLLSSLLSVSAFFALNSPNLVIERLDPLVKPGGIASHLHTVLGGNHWSDTYSYENQISSTCTTMPVSVDKSNYWSHHTHTHTHTHTHRRRHQV